MDPLLPGRHSLLVGSDRATERLKRVKTLGPRAIYAVSASLGTKRLMLGVGCLVLLVKIGLGLESHPAKSLLQCRCS